MSIINKLLETDSNKLLAESKSYEVKRLSEAIGEPFIIKCSPLTSEQIVHLSEISKTNSDLQINTIIEACSIEGKKLNDKDLMNKFNTVIATDLVKKMFLPGEIYKIYFCINDLSGYKDDTIEEIKN